MWESGCQGSTAAARIQFGIVTPVARKQLGCHQLINDN